MFTNLIESDSHRKEFKRRGSFFLATVAGYALILFAAGVAGIYAYDARVEAQTTDLILDSWIPPVKPVERVTPRATAPNRRTTRTNAPVDPHVKVPERTAIVPPVSDLTKIPDEIGTKGSDIPPVTGPVQLSTRNVDPPSSPSGNPGGCENCPGTKPAVVVEEKKPPVVEPVKPPTQHVTSVVLTSKVVSLPKPAYPMIAKQIHAQGPVNVQILVDESGKVLSAQVVSGHPTLAGAAKEAALRARFTPTMLNNQPVKVQGVITYNFVLQ